MSGADEPRRDPHLQAALRHAPDTDVGVPPLVRARIVAAARRSAEEAQRRRPWWRRLGSAGMPWRMGGAGTAAAAVLAATVLWVGRDEQPAAPDLRPALPAATSPAPQAGPGTPASPSAPGVPAGVTDEGVPASSGRPSPQQSAPRVERAAGEARTAAPVPFPSPATPATPAPTAAEPVDATRAPPPPRARVPATAAPQAERATEAPPPPTAAQARDADHAARAVARQAAAERAAAEQAAARAARSREVEGTRQASEAARRLQGGAASRAEPVDDGAVAQGAAPRAARSPSGGEVAPPSPAAPPPPPPAAAAPPADVRAFEGAAGGVRASPPASPAPSPRAAPPAGDRPSALADAAPTASRIARPSAAASPGSGASDLAVGGATPAPARAGAEQRERSVAHPLVERLLAEPDPAAWRYNTANGDVTLPVGWWARLAEATRGRWEAAPAGTVPAGEAWLLTRPDGRRLRLVWAPDVVALCDVQANRCERARVEGPAQAKLREELGR